MRTLSIHIISHSILWAFCWEFWTAGWQVQNRHIWKLKYFIFDNKTLECGKTLPMLLFDHFLKKSHWVPMTCSPQRVKKKEDNVPRWGWTPPAYCPFKCSLYYTIFHSYSSFTFNVTHLYCSHFSHIFPFVSFGAHFPICLLWATFCVASTFLVQASRVICHSHTRMVYWQCAGLEQPTLWLRDQHTNHYTILSPLLSTFFQLSFKFLYKHEVLILM